MPAKAQRSPGTIAAYERETGRLVAQYQRENADDVPRAPLVQTVDWFLKEHARWAGTTIRLFANALEQEMGRMLEFDSFDPDSEEALLLRRLKNDRPSPVVETKKSAKAKAVAHQQKVAAKKKRGRNLVNRSLCPSFASSSAIFARATMNFRSGLPDILFLRPALVGVPVKCLFCSAKVIFFGPAPKSTPTAAV